MLFSKNYSISVPEPCHEKWENMHPVTGGRFCDSCAKNVVDFTEMTEKEIIHYFKNKQHTGCGRFAASQVEKNYVVRTPLKLPFHQRFFSYLLSFFVSGGMISKAVAQTDTTAIVQRDSTNLLAGNDSLLQQRDSLAVADEDTANCADDSVVAGIQLKISMPDMPEIIYCPVVTVEVVYGGFVWREPVENPNPGFLDFMKVKFHDSLSVLKRTGGIVEAGSVPSKTEKNKNPEKPAKKDTTVASAILPDDDVKRKNSKKYTAKDLL